MSHRSGRHFLQIPGPTNVPDRVLRAIDGPTIDHRGPEFATPRPRGARRPARRLQDRVARSSSTPPPAPARGRRRSSTRCRPATACSRSRPATSRRCGARWPSGSGLEVAVGRGRLAPRRRPRARSRERLPTRIRASRAVMVVHNETSTGVTSRVPEIRAAIDAAGHDALLLVDVISSLGSIDYRHEEWGVDVTVGGSQKGLMLPAGPRLQRGQPEGAGRRRARAAAALLLGLAADRRGQRDRLLALHARRRTCSTGCARRSRCCARRGSTTVFARHARHAAATRAAVEAWGLEVLALDPRELVRGADRRGGARGPRRRRGAARDPRALRHVARRRASASSRAGSSASAISATSTT